MTHWKKVLLVVCASCFAGVTDVAGGSGRQKRELRFPKGTSVVAAVALSSSFPKGPTDGLAHVLELDLGFPFPEKFSIEMKETQKKSHNELSRKRYTKPSKKWRKKRSLKEKQKEELLLRLNDAITRIGFNGSSCISRFCCELRYISEENSLLEHLLLALFKPASEPDEKECAEFQRNCPFSLLQIIMHSKQVQPTHGMPQGIQ